MKLYRNNLKSREFDQEAAQILESGASDIAYEQGASEDPKFVAKPTLSKIYSSSCFGILLIATLFILGMTTFGYSAPKHRRDSEALPTRDREFAEKLSVRHRKIFCGQFNQAQRDETIKYARGLGQDKCYTPDEAVLRVMEETGMSLALKGRPDSKKMAE